jgi:hypothetical protein
MSDDFYYGWWKFNMKQDMLPEPDVEDGSNKLGFAVICGNYDEQVTRSFYEAHSHSRRKFQVFGQKARLDIPQDKPGIKRFLQWLLEQCITDATSPSSWGTAFLTASVITRYRLDEIDYTFERFQLDGKHEIILHDQNRSERRVPFCRHLAVSAQKAIEDHMHKCCSPLLNNFRQQLMHCLNSLPLELRRLSLTYLDALF